MEDLNLGEEGYLIGYQVPIDIGGNVLQFIVQHELENGNYLLRFGDFEEQMTKEEILADKECVDEILAHNCKKGNFAQMQVKWCDGGDTEWEPLQSLQKEVPNFSVEYDSKNSLLED